MPGWPVNTAECGPGVVIGGAMLMNYSKSQGIAMSVPERGTIVPKEHFPSNK